LSQKIWGGSLNRKGPRCGGDPKISLLHLRSQFFHGDLISA